MTTVNVGTIDVYLIDPAPEGWGVLAVQRAHSTRCPTAWETVHGTMERGGNSPSLGTGRSKR